MTIVTGSLNLSALKHIKMKAKGQNGEVDGLFIPIKANKLFASEKGNTYLNLVAFEMKEKKDYGTHIVKQSLNKEEREKMTDEEKREMPILGNLNVDNSPAETSNDEGDGKTFKQDDEVPF